MLKRRTFLTGAAAGIVAPAWAQSIPPPTKPNMLQRGDRVAVIDPSTAIYDPAAIERARLIIEALDLVPVFAPHTLGRSRELKASVTERLADLHNAFDNHDIKGVFCARGGYGVSEIVSDVDYSLIRRNPKVFVGFSDITLLHLAIRKQANLVTFHGRMPALTRFPPFSLAALRRAICAPKSLGQLANPKEPDPLRPVYPLRTISPGMASGRLTGGNLSMIAASMGTAWEINTSGAVFFFEDVDEQPYAIARMLFQLRQAGKLAVAAAIVVGACAGCDQVSDSSPYTLNEVFDLVLGDLKIPAFSGLVLGHTDEQLTVPLGVQARVDATACSLSILETGVQ